MHKNTKTNCGVFAILKIKPNQEVIFNETLILDNIVSIHYGFHDTIFGKCVIGLYEEHICYLAFFDTAVSSTKELVLSGLEQKWGSLNLIYDEAKTFPFIKALNLVFDNKHENQEIKLLFKGTNLQLKTWQELSYIPYGATISYSKVAEQINSNAVRAVASAIANNHIAYLIPCHRVIRKSGDINKYRWGVKVKSLMLDYEAKG